MNQVHQHLLRWRLTDRRAVAMYFVEVEQILQSLGSLLASKPIEKLLQKILHENLLTLITWDGPKVHDAYGRLSLGLTEPAVEIRRLANEPGLGPSIPDS